MKTILTYGDSLTFGAELLAAFKGLDRDSDHDAGIGRFMRHLAAFVLALASPTATLAVEVGAVTEVDGGVMDRIQRAPTPEVRDMMRDTTMLVKLGALDPVLLVALPFGADAVLYFAENGDLLAWSDKSTLIELGYWEVIANSGFNELCVRFGAFGLNSVCASPQIATSDWPRQMTDGNPFALAAGQPAPILLGPAPFTLKEIAAQLP